MGEGRFNIILTGEIAPGADIEIVKQTLAKAFRAGEKEIDALFANTPKVIKRNAPAPICAATKKVLDFAGAGCQIVPAKKQPAP